MLVYDGIIENLQSMGGVTVLFKEIISRNKMKDVICYAYSKNSNIFNGMDNIIFQNSRVLERYRRFHIKINENDIFHSTYYRLPKYKAKTITTVHDFTYEKFVQGFARRVHVWQKHNAILNSDHIICVSKNTANDLKKYCNVPDEKISIIYNGVADDYFPLNINHTNEVLFVGARGGYKNFNMAVEAIKLSKLFKLLIVGSPLSVHEIKFLNEKIPNRYIYLGRLTNQELNIKYNSAYALLYPSFYEGFGIPPLEAMKAGCPVIALNNSSLPEVVGDAGLLVENASADTLYDALLSIENSRSKLVTSGYSQANKFSWDKCYDKTNEVYRKFL